MLWELFSYGQIPYPGMTNTEVIQRVIAGYRLDCPQGCPKELYELMGRCWHHKPEARPSFKQIYDKIHSICNEQSMEIVVEPSFDIQPPSNSNYSNRASNYNNQIVVGQSNYNNQVVVIQPNSISASSNYNNQIINNYN